MRKAGRRSVVKEKDMVRDEEDRRQPQGEVEVEVKGLEKETRKKATLKA